MKIVGTLKAILGLDKSKFDAGLKSAEKGANTFGKSLKSIFATAGIALGLRELARFGSEVVKLGAKAEGIRSAFNRLNSPALLNNLRIATRNTVSDIDLMSAAVRADNFHISLKALPKYFEFAQQRARATGESVDYLVESIVMGIGRKSAMILDNLGISLNDINEELKVTPDYATAVGNIMAREMAKAGKATETAADNMEQLRTAWKNMMTEMGEGKAAQFVTKVMGNMAEEMRIRNDPNLTRKQKSDFIWPRGSGAYDKYLADQAELSSATGYNPAANVAAKMGLSTGFNMTAGLTGSPAKPIEEVTEAVEEADKTIKRTIMDAEKLWNSLLLPAQAGQQFEGTWGALSDSFAKSDELAKTQENLAGLGASYDDINNKVLNLSNSLTDVFYGALTGDDFFKSMGESLKRLAAQFAATAMAAAVLAFAISMIPGFGQAMGVSKGLQFGDIFGKILKGGLGLGMASGGEIPGGYPNDTFPAMLSSGETVLTARQSQWLKDGIKVNVTGIIRNKDLSLASRRSNYSN